jgi:hypothetical protein
MHIRVVRYSHLFFGAVSTRCFFLSMVHIIEFPREGGDRLFDYIVQQDDTIFSISVYSHYDSATASCHPFPCRDWFGAVRHCEFLCYKIFARSLR